MCMNVIVVSDYDGYFEGLTRKIISLVENPKYKNVRVTAGPFRPHALTVNYEDKDTVNFDFYSAIRNGFGSLSEADMYCAAKLLEE